MPVFDKKGKIVNRDKAKVGDDFPKMKDIDEISKSGIKKSVSLPHKISKTSIVLAVVVAVLLIAIIMLAVKINTLNEEVTALSNEKEQFGVTQTNLQETNAEKERLKAELSLAENDLETAKAQKSELDSQVRKLEEAATRKPQPVAAHKKPNGQKKK